MRHAARFFVCLLQLLLLAACTSRVQPASRGATDLDFGTLPPNEPLVVLESVASFLWNITPSRRFPRFALYPTGLVIALSASPPGDTYVTAHLSAAEMASLLDSLNVRLLPDFAGEEYVVSRGVHTQVHILSVRRDDGTYAYIEVTGWLDSFPSQALPIFPPEALHKAIHQLFEFEPSGAATWNPGEYELYSWPCGGGTSNASVWPDDWPQLPHDAPQAGAMWNVTRLTTADSVRVRGTLGPSINTMHRYVRAGTFAWCVTYRPVLPGEDVWRQVASAPSAGAN